MWEGIEVIFEAFDIAGMAISLRSMLEPAEGKVSRQYDPFV